jgi:DNA-binding response OmpR family regulator
MNLSITIYKNQIEMGKPLDKKPAKKKILIVDDDPDMRIFFSTLLKTNGFRPIVAKDGDEGIKKAVKESPVFIIIDVTLPENGGMKMYRSLKKDRELNQIPVIMTSTIDIQTFTHYQKAKGLNLGKDIVKPAAFLEKPPEAKEVLSLIEQILSKGKKGK